MSTACAHAVTLAEDGDAKARAYAWSIRQFDFIIALHVTDYVLSHIAALSNMLQGQLLDLVEASNESGLVIKILRDERNDPIVWDELFNRAKKRPS